MSMMIRSGTAAWLLAAAVVGGPAPAGNEGQAELDQATQAKLTASTVTDLGEVIRLAESAMEKGLDDQSAEFARQLLAATRIERGLYVAVAIYSSPLPDPKWAEWRRLALDDLEKGVELAPQQPQALFRIVQLNLLPGGDAKRAAEALDEVIRLSTEEVSLRATALTMRAALQEDAQKKLADLSEAVRSNPRAVDALRARASVYADQEKLDLALADLDAAISLDPHHAPTHLARGVILIESERYDEALESLAKARELAPKSAAPLLQRARALGLQSKFKEALEDLNQAYLLEPNNLGVLLMRASVYQQLDRPEDGLADVDQALRLREGLGPAMRLRAMLLAGSGEFDEAIAQLEELQKTESGDVSDRLRLAMLLNADQRPRKAIDIYSAILAAEPDNPIALQGRGDALLGIGEHAKAVQDYEKALKFTSRDDSLLNNFAWVLATSPEEELRDGRRAIELATKACELTDYEQAHILSTLAAGYAETGDFETATKWSQKAVELGSEDQKEVLSKELESYRQGKPWRERQNTPEAEEPEPAKQLEPEPEVPEPAAEPPTEPSEEEPKPQ